MDMEHGRASVNQSDVSVAAVTEHAETFQPVQKLELPRGHSEMIPNENMCTRSRVDDSFVIDSTCGASCSLVRVLYCWQPCLVHTSASGTKLPQD